LGAYRNSEVGEHDFSSATHASPVHGTVTLNADGSGSLTGTLEEYFYTGNTDVIQGSWGPCSIRKSSGAWPSGSTFIPTLPTNEVEAAAAAAQDSSPGVLIPLLALLIFAPELLGLGAAGEGVADTALVDESAVGEGVDPATLQAEYDRAVADFNAPLSAEGQTYLDQALAQGVSTERDQIVLYSGPGSKVGAQKFAEANGRYTLEQTPGGQWLEEQNLYDQLDRAEADRVWGRLSEAFVQQGSGSVVDFTGEAESGRIFHQRELQAILDNPDITNLIEGN
jgi:hypothetical protein